MIDFVILSALHDWTRNLFKGIGEYLLKYLWLILLVCFLVGLIVWILRKSVKRMVRSDNKVIKVIGIIIVIVGVILAFYLKLKG